MAVLDFLTGQKGIDRIQERAEGVARRRFDPDVFEPSIDHARSRATEGVPDEIQDIFRTRTTGELFRERDPNEFGGRGAQALAGRQRQTETGQRALAQFEGDLATQDTEVRLRGEEQLSQLLSQQRQVEAQRDAAIEEAGLQADQEAQRRRRQLGTAALGIAGSVITTPLGVGGATLGATLASKGISRLFGGGENMDAPERPFVEGERPHDEIVSDQIDFGLAPERPFVEGERPHDEIVSDQIDFGLAPEFQGTLAPDIEPRSTQGFSGEETDSLRAEFESYLQRQQEEVLGTQERIPEIGERELPGPIRGVRNIFGSAQRDLGTLWDMAKGPTREELFEQFLEDRRLQQR